MPTEFTYDAERHYERPRIQMRYLGRELPVEFVELKGTTALNQYISDSMQNILNLPVHDEVSVSGPEVEGMLRAREVSERSPLTEERLSEIRSWYTSGRADSTKPNTATPPRSCNYDNVCTDPEFYRALAEAEKETREALKEPPEPEKPNVWLVMPSDVRESARLTPIGAEPALGGWSSYYAED